jgi:hypothetical protein
MIFNEIEMKLIYTNLIGYVGLNSNIDYKTEKAIGAVLDKIESIVPEIKRHEDYEKLELVEDNGLKL